jgi:hypothetical protein
VEAFSAKTGLVLTDMKIEKYLNQVSTAKFISGASEDTAALSYT